MNTQAQNTMKSLLCRIKGILCGNARTIECVEDVLSSSPLNCQK